MCVKNQNNDHFELSVTLSVTDLNNTGHVSNIKLMHGWRKRLARCASHH